MSEQKDVTEILTRLQEHVPFLKDMIVNLKIGMPQHDKIVALHNMITNKKRKFKYDVLRKCEEVILKMKSKTNYKPPSKSPNDDENYTIDSPDPDVSEHIEKQISSSERYVQEKPSVYSSAAETIGKTPKINVFDRLGSIVPELDTSKPPLSVADLELLKSDDVEENVAVEPPKVEEKLIVKKESKISLVPAPLMKPRPKPDKQNSENEKKTERYFEGKSPKTKTEKEDSKEKNEKENTKEKNEKESSKTERCRINSSPIIKNPSPVKKPTSEKNKLVEKIIRDTDSIFGNLLSSIDDKIRSQKRLSGEKVEKREKRLSLSEKTPEVLSDTKSANSSVETEPVVLPNVLKNLFSDIEKPKFDKVTNIVAKDSTDSVKTLESTPIVSSPEKVYKRLADKYNPKPRKPSTGDVPKLVEDSVILKPDNMPKIPFLSPDRNLFDGVHKVDPRINNKSSDIINKQSDTFLPENEFKSSHSPRWEAPMDISDNSPTYGNSTPVYTNPLAPPQHETHIFQSNQGFQNLNMRPNFHAGNNFPRMQNRNNFQPLRQTFNFQPPPQQNQRPVDPRKNPTHLFSPFESMNKDVDKQQNDFFTSPDSQYAQSNQFMRNNNPGSRTPNPYNPGSQTPNPYNSGSLTPNPYNSGSQTPNPYSGNHTPNPYSAPQNSFTGPSGSQTPNPYNSNNLQYQNFKPFNNRYPQQNFQYNNRFNNRDMDTPTTYKSWREERGSRDPRLSRNQEFNNFNKRDEHGGGRWQREKSIPREDRFERGKSVSREDSRDDRFARGKSVTREDPRDDRFARGKSVTREDPRDDRFARGKSVTRDESSDNRFSRGKSVTRDDPKDSRPARDDPRDNRFSRGKSITRDDPRNERFSREDPRENKFSRDRARSQERGRYSRDQRGKSVSRDNSISDRYEQEKSMGREKSVSREGRAKSVSRQERNKSISRDKLDAQEDELNPGLYSCRDEFLSKTRRKSDLPDKTVAKDTRDSKKPQTSKSSRVLRMRTKSYVEDNASSESNSRDTSPDVSKHARKTRRNKYDEIYSSLVSEKDDNLNKHDKKPKKEVSLQSFKIPKKSKPEETEANNEHKEDTEDITKHKPKENEVVKKEKPNIKCNKNEKSKTVSKDGKKCIPKDTMREEKESDKNESEDELGKIIVKKSQSKKRIIVSEDEESEKEEKIVAEKKEEVVEEKIEDPVTEKDIILKNSDNAEIVTSNEEIEMNNTALSTNEEVTKLEVTSSDDPPIVSSSTEVNDSKEMPINDLAKKMESQTDKLGLPPTVKEEFKKFISNISKSVGAPMPLLEMFGMLVDYIKPTDAEASTSVSKDEDKKVEEKNENAVDLPEVNNDTEMPLVTQIREVDEELPSSSLDGDAKESSESSPTFKRKVIKKTKKGGKKVVKKPIEDSDDDLSLDALKKKMPPPKKARRSELDKLHEDIKETMGEGVLAVTNKRTCTIHKDLLEDVKVDDTILEKVKEVKVVLQKLPDIKKPKRRMEVEPDESLILPKRRSMNRATKTTNITYADDEEISKDPDDESAFIDIESDKISEEVLKPPEEVKVLRKKRPSSVSPIKSPLKKKKMPTENTDDKDESPKVKKSNIEEDKKNKIEVKNKKSNKTTDLLQSESEDNQVTKSKIQSDSDDDIGNVNSLSESEIEGEICYIEPDKNHCLIHNTDATYKCKVCEYEGSAIVDHYAIKHPKIGCVISRLSPENTELAFQEAENEDLEDIELLDKRSKNYFRCRFCLHAFEEVQSLYFYNHLTKHTGEFRFKCTKCHYKTSERKAVGVHYSEEHNITANYSHMTADFTPALVKKVCGYVCSECNFLQLNKLSVEEHIQIYHLDDTAYVRKINMSLKRENKIKPLPKPKKVKRLSAITAESNIETIQHIDKTIEDVVNSNKNEEDNVVKEAKVSSISNDLSCEIDQKPNYSNETTKSDDEVKESKELDISVFMCDTDIEDETMATRLEKMKEINESVTPRRTSIVNKLKYRLDQEDQAKKDDAIDIKVDVPTTKLEKKDESHVINKHVNQIMLGETSDSGIIKESKDRDSESYVNKRKIDSILSAASVDQSNDELINKESSISVESSKTELNAPSDKKEQIIMKSETKGTLKLRNDLFAKDSEKPKEPDYLLRVIEVSEPPSSTPPALGPIKAITSSTLAPFTTRNTALSTFTISAFPQTTPTIAINNFSSASPSITLNTFATTRPAFTITSLPNATTTTLLNPIPGSSVLRTPFIPTLNAISVPLTMFNSQSTTAPIIAISTFPTPSTVSASTSSKTSPPPPLLTHAEEAQVEDKTQTNLLPKLSRIPCLTPSKEKKQLDRVFTAAGVSIILSKNRELRYECKKSCIFITSARALFESHCNFVHKMEKMGVSCSECDDTSIFNREQIFKHLCKHVDEELARLNGSESIVISDDEETPKFSFKIASVQSLAPKKTTVNNTPIILNNLPSLVPLIKSPVKIVTTSPVTSIPVATIPTQTTSGTDTHTKIFIIQPPNTNSANTNTNPTNTNTESKILTCRLVPLTEEEMKSTRKAEQVLQMWSNPEIWRRLFKCPFPSCLFTATKEDVFDSHLESHKFGGLINCLYCNFKMKVEYYVVHLVVRHRYCNYGCPHCLYRAISEDYVNYHLSEEHPEAEKKVLVFKEEVHFTRYRSPPLKSMKEYMKPYACKCSKKFYAKENFTKHLKSCQENKSRFIAWNIFEYNCRYCSFSEPTKRSFLKHMAKHHPYHPICIVTRHLKDPADVQEDEDATIFDKLKKISWLSDDSSDGDVIDVTKTDTDVPETNPQIGENSNSKENLEDSTDLSTEDIDEDTPVKTAGLIGSELFKCANCKEGVLYSSAFRNHVLQCGSVDGKIKKKFNCMHCDKVFKAAFSLVEHIKLHGIVRIGCSLCTYRSTHQGILRNHMKVTHKILHCKFVPVDPTKTNSDTDEFIACPATHRSSNAEASSSPRDISTTPNPPDTPLNSFGPDNIHLLPIKSIFNYNISCNLCNFQTKVRMNLIRHMSQHEQGKETTATAPVNPVPCLEKNEMMFDKMTNLASSSHAGGRMGGKPVSSEPEVHYPTFIPLNKRYVCGAKYCNYLCLEEAMLKHHLQALHAHEDTYICAHCKINLALENGNINVDLILKHLRLHDHSLYKCGYCSHMSNVKAKIEKHCSEKHSEKCIKIVTARELTENASSSSKDGVKKKPWKCSMCKSQFYNKEDVRAHVESKHAIDCQYKCSYCTYKSDDRDSFNAHFDSNHANKKVDIIVCFYYSDGEVAVKPQEENAEAFDTTPLWLKSKNYVRHIRGILIEDQPKFAKKSPIKVGSLTGEKIEKKPNVKEEKEKKMLKVDKEKKLMKDDSEKKPLNKDCNEKETTVVKEEKAEQEESESDTSGLSNLDLAIEAVATGNFTVDVTNITAQDPPLSEISSMPIAKLRKQNYVGEFGPLVRPIRDRYRCPLCPSFTTKEVNAFETHLQRELKYFKHGCNMCSYADVSLTNIQEHLLKEHSNELNYTSYCFVAHPVNKAIEDWIFKLRLFQFRFIKDYMERQQKSQIKNKSSNQKQGTSVDVESTTEPDVEKLDEKEPLNEMDNNMDLQDPAMLLMEIKRVDADCDENRDRKTKSFEDAVKPFKCSACDYNTMKYTAIKKHIMKCHANGCAYIKDALGFTLLKAANVCFYCNQDTVHKKYLVNHYRHRHPGMEMAIKCHQDADNIKTPLPSSAADRYKCAHCDFENKEFEELKQHYFANHSGEDFDYIEFGGMKLVADTKKDIVVRKGPIDITKTLPDNIDYLKCGHCELIFKEAVLLKKHFTSQHSGEDIIYFEYKKGKCKETARKSTVDVEVQKSERPFSFYGEKPDLTQEECRLLQTELKVNESSIMLSVAQYSKMVNIFPVVKVVDCQTNDDSESIDKNIPMCI